MSKKENVKPLIDRYRRLRKQLEPVLNKNSNDVLLEVEVLLQMQLGDGVPKLEKRKPTHEELVAKYYFK